MVQFWLLTFDIWGFVITRIRGLRRGQRTKYASTDQQIYALFVSVTLLSSQILLFPLPCLFEMQITHYHKRFTERREGIRKKGMPPVLFDDLLLLSEEFSISSAAVLSLLLRFWYGTG